MSIFVIFLFSYIFLSKLTSNNLNNCEDPDPSDPDDDKELWGSFKEEDYIKVNSETATLNKGKGTGDKIVLKGTNAGGYLVTEHWMCATGGSGDHLNITKDFIDRFGANEAVNLWTYYRDNFWTDQDFDNCLDMGMNVIRLPFTYMTVDPNYCNVARNARGGEYNFSILDSFVQKAAERGIYVILDLHGAYGSQNGQDHSGQTISDVNNVDFYSNTYNKLHTVHLWEELAKHYKDNPAIAGFDLLNEPAEKGGNTSTRHFEFYDELYKAIRAIDQDRVLIMESCWNGANLPQPSEYGWENVMYSFHHYSYNANYTADDYLKSFQDKINEVMSQEFNVPIYLGEFTCYDLKASREAVLSLLNKNGWSYTPWTYKLNLSPGSGSSYPGWAIYYTKAERINSNEDSIEQIKDKRYKVDTAYEDTEEMKFDGIYSFHDLLKAYL